MPNTVPPEMWGDGPSELPQDICISALLDAQNLTPALQSVVASCPGGWAITSAAANFLGQLVGQLQPKSVLEFGAGSSSVVLATALSLGGVADSPPLSSRRAGASINGPWSSNRKRLMPP